MFNLIPKEFASCKAVPKEILDELKYWGDEFLHPVKFAETAVKALWTHRKELGSDVTSFIGSTAKGDYFTAGQDLGDFLSIILGSPENFEILLK